jgi:7-carboxy-7-deazaguanine synthase
MTTVKAQGQLERSEAARRKKFPVVEVFGPTIQGEGIDQGVSCYFIRLGGCDYRCVWCDSPFAVLPELVRRATRLNSEEIVSKVAALTPGPSWIVISGGNPVLHDLWFLVDMLHGAGYKVAVETQGTVFKEWLWRVDRVCVSPKPPSSEYTTDLDVLRNFLEVCHPVTGTVFLKVVVQTVTDYNYAKLVHRHFSSLPMFISACNNAGSTVGNPAGEDHRSEDQVAKDLINSGRRLANRLMIDPDMADVRVQVQNHVLYWGNERGH